MNTRWICQKTLTTLLTSQCVTSHRQQPPMTTAMCLQLSSPARTADLAGKGSSSFPNRLVSGLLFS